MARLHPFRFPLRNGLHARPASHLAEAARPFQAAITFVNERTGRFANAKSVLALAGTDTREGDPCRIEMAGADEEAAWTALTVFLAGAFAGCDESLPEEAPPGAGGTIVPRSLRAAGLARFHAGKIACRGLGWGSIVVAGGFVLPARFQSEKAAGADEERAKFGRARARVQADYERALAAARATEAGILRAHLGILCDPGLTEEIDRRIGDGSTAAQAVVAAVATNAEKLRAAESAYLRERVLDLEDIGGRLLEKIGGPELSAPLPALAAPAVLVAESLTPTQFLALDRNHLRALVLGRAGQTSHTVILARSFGIPTLTGLALPAGLARPGVEAIVDANVGILIPEVTAGVRRYYEREQAKFARMAGELAARCHRPGATRDGRRLEIGANVATGDEAAGAFARGAEGIGLFRTELLFADRTEAPSEDEQRAHYSAAVRAAAGRPVIIRTLDAGGDKPVAFLPFPSEANPFLGYRGVRFYGEHAELMKTQFRALLRAAADGPLKVMIPMVACLEEARLARRLFDEAREELRAAGGADGREVPLGFMLEVPSVAFILDELCAEADFFSLGTNDLTQYFLAADRENAKVANLSSAYHPGFLRLLQHIVGGVRARGRWIGLCGELAEDPAALPLLVALRLDEISLAAPRIAGQKAALAELDAPACDELLGRVLRCATREEVERTLRAPLARARPMLTPDLVLGDVAAGTKEEVIREMVDALHVAGRTDRPEAVEEAIWLREDTYSTGFGEGFALPHCQSDNLAAGSIVIARLRAPVDWHSVDGQPVDTVILLGIRASEHGTEHLKTLARLSRLVMQDEFRALLRNEGDGVRLADAIKARLGSS